MRRYRKRLVLLLIISFMFCEIGAAAPGSQGQSVDIESGIIFATLTSATRSNGAIYGAVSGEKLEFVLGPRGSTTNLAAFAAYGLGKGAYGLGFSAAYANDTLTNYMAAGFNAQFVQLGFNALFEANTFASSGNIGLRVGKEKGLAFAATFRDFWSVASSSFKGAIGYSTQSYLFEVNSPIQLYDLTSSWKLIPTISFTYIGLKGLSLNVGLSQIDLGTGELNSGKTHAGIFYWLTDKIGVGAYYRKYDLDYSLSLQSSL